ncbi:serine hydrolase domain-containing protein [Nocardia araoensis]|uniref:serine hydrolase domain-containing protein n=1 Tax=Nocardia araoensis TaxID=228600 RepID=UPI001FDEB469|nr:serine hydrolase domain-containing protein [Nocardia araoensis]
MNSTAIETSTTITLSDQDKRTLRTAAYGALSLLAATGTPHTAATSGSIALTSATGLVGHVLAAKSKDIELPGKTVAELADQVLPALTAAMKLLARQDPAEAENFRSTVLIAVEAAARSRRGEPTTAAMARKITAALDAAADSGAVPVAVAGPDRPELQKALEDIVASGFIGITLRVHDQRGEWVGSAGVSKLGETAKPPADGHVRIGSNTKTFIATLVLRLVAEGKLGLDDPAADHLPEFGLDPRITVRMLLQHTSGVFNFTGEYYEDGTVVPGIPATTAGKEWVDNRFETYQPEELVRLALSKPARFEPGTDWSYSNTNYVLARLLIEKVTGRPVAQEMQRSILGPLGLSGTVAPTTQTELPEPHAHAYYRYQEAGHEKIVDVTSHNPSWISSGGDMISTTQDLHTFISALVTGKLLPAPLLAEMRTPHPTPIPNMGYGLGVFVQDTGLGGTLVTHNGGAAGHAALMYSTPDGEKTMTATLNYADDAALSLAVAFQKATQRLVDEVFCGGQADPAQPTG